MNMPIPKINFEVIVGINWMALAEKLKSGGERSEYIKKLWSVLTSKNDTRIYALRR